MKKLFFYKGKPIAQDLPIPQMLPETILVQNYYSFVSRGTELAMLQRNQISIFNKVMQNFSDSLLKLTDSLQAKGFTSTIFNIKSTMTKKMEVGYASSGIVVASASHNFRVGDYVACAGVGIATHSEFCVVPTNLAVTLKNASRLQEASATALGAIALQGLRRSGLVIGEIVCVFGLGLLGLLTVQLAKLSGLTVVGVDINQDNLFLADGFGADHVVLVEPNTDWLSKIINISGSHGVDAVIVTASSNNDKLLDQAITLCRKKGKIVVSGSVPLVFEREAFYLKELDLLISCSYGPGRYDAGYEHVGIDYPYSYVRWTEGRNLQFVADLICADKLKVDKLISGVYNLDQAQDAYHSLGDGSLGVVFSYIPEKTETLSFEEELLSISKSQELDSEIVCLTESIKDFSLKENLVCALVGAGGFAKTMLMPILARIDHVDLAMVYDSSVARSLDFAETFGFLDIARSFESIIRCKDVDLVVVASSDVVHCEQSINVLKYGKAVFCEKPMVQNWNQFFSLKEFLEKNKKSFFAVDFNRPFAPMIQSLSLALKSRVSPLMINYRVNAGISCDINNPIKRIVGEVCHFLELFLFLVKADPVQMSATFSKADAGIYKENLTIVLSFNDGSLANLMYSSVAHNDSGKERGEFFWDQKSAVLEDFKSLIGYGIGSDFDQYNIVPDKGHANHLSSFICSVKKNDSTIFSKSWPRYFLATWLSLKLEELLTQNGGVLDIKNYNFSFE